MMWNILGYSGMCWGLLGHPQDSEKDEDEEEEDPTEDPHAEQEDDQVKEKPNEVVQSLHMVETGLELEKALAAESTELEKASPQVSVDDALPDNSEDTEEPEVKKMKVDRCVKTLRDVLTMSGLAQFNPSSEDTEHDLFQRIKKVRPFLNSFSTLVRCGEGLLGRAVVTGDTSKLNPQQIFEMELAKANLEYHCSGQRQSKHALWADYSQRLFQAAKAAATETEPQEDAEVPVKEITYLRPCSYLGADGQRVSQIVLVRTCMAGNEAGSLRLGASDAHGRISFDIFDHFRSLFLNTIANHRYP